MAFCSKCGTQIQDGAKFCPKCGQPTSNAGNVEEPETYNSFDNEPEEDIQTWQKIVSILLWPVGVIILIVALIKKQSGKAKSALLYTIIGIGLVIALNVYLGGCSTDVLNTIEDEIVDSESSDIEEAGYNEGYEMGFQLGGSYDEGEGSIPYTRTYGAPSTPEEKQQYRLYENAYKKGYQDGAKAKN